MMQKDKPMMTPPPSLSDLRIKIFADGAELEQIRSLSALPYVSGFTTNPTLMRKAGIADYEGFARSVLEVVTDRPVSFEVFADEPDSMLAQARVIASWGANVNVKIPVTTTRGEFCGRVIETLSREGVILNVTAIMTNEQVAQVAGLLAPQTPAIVSVFAGRIADTGRDPVPLMREAAAILRDRPKAQLLWAYHHRDPGAAGEAQPAREGSPRLLPRNRPHVPPRRDERRLRHRHGGGNRPVKDFDT
jgi:transaldolase